MTNQEPLLISTCVGSKSTKRVFVSQVLMCVVQGTICPVCASAAAESIPVCVIFLSQLRNCDAAIVLLAVRLRTDRTSQTCSIRAN